MSYSYFERVGFPILATGFGITMVCGLGFASTLSVSTAVTIYNEIRSKGIVKDVEMHFDEKCSRKFNILVRGLYIDTPLSRGESYVCAYEKWKKNGEWDACMKGDSERV